MDLKARGKCHVKYADDTTLVVAEHADVSFADEFNIIRQWSADDRNKIKYYKN